MDVAQPYRAIVPSLEGAVLNVLVGTTAPLTGRQIARMVKRGSQAGVAKTLRRLAEHGLVETQHAGRAILFTLNLDHLLAAVLRPLFSIREILIQRVTETLNAWAPRPVHASLFGSAARGDGDVNSDIDLFLVRPARVHENTVRWRNQCAQLGLDVRRWTGNALGLSEVSVTELAALGRSQPLIVRNLKSQSITLLGRSAATLLSSQGRADK